MLKSINQSKSVFSQYGISEDLPKLGISSLSQGEHLVEHLLRTVEYEGTRKDAEAYVVKHTDRKGNIDIRFKYDAKKVDEKEGFVEMIESSTRMQYQLRNWAQSYDPKSVRVLEHDDRHVTVSFNYSKYGLPQDIAYFRHMRVEIEIFDGNPQTMTITNRSKFNLEGINVSSYKQVITFKSEHSNESLIDKRIVEIEGSKKGKPIKVTEITEPVALYDDSGVNIMDEPLLAEISDPRLREEKVEINRTFPLLGDMVRQQGIDIPLPFGISIAYRNQDMNLPTNDFIIQGVRLNEIFDPNDTIATVAAESVTLRGDVNILPFWNVFGFVGKINVDANVDASYTGKIGEELQDKLNDRLPGLGDKFCDEVSVLCDTGRLNVPLQLEYDALGVGSTLSIGYKEFFASVTGTYSLTRLKGNTDWGDGIVTVQPMLGYQLVDYRAQLFVGAEYQGLKNRMQGHVAAGGIEFDYDVGVDVNNWAYLAGFNKQLGKNYNLSFLYNKGESRNSMTLNLGYRF
ncbi:hypothetical protein AAFX24_16345 [Vibrio mediterranei]|uniref:hypothetical protein n=1 Tax=Vibrio mediterranei TaxID=689 RepID=UPI0038CE09A2